MGRLQRITQMTGCKRLLVLSLPIVLLSPMACEGCRSTQDARSGAAIAAAGADGPPTLRLVFVSDLAGALEPCGCTKDQLGGLDHFGAWMTSTRAQAQGRLVASAGPLFFMDAKLDPERSAQDRAKAQTIARVLKPLDFAAFAPGENDWAAGADTLAALTRASGAVAIAPVDADGNGGASAFGTSSVRVVEASGLHVGFVGYGRAPQTAGAAADVSPEALVKRGVSEAKAHGADVLVALAATGRGEAKRIADAVPELTAVVVGSPQSNGDGNTETPAVERLGDTLVIQTANHLQSVAVLDLYVRGPRSAGVLKFADGTGLELASRRQDLLRRIDDLHVKIAAWERDGTVAAADLAARRQDLAKLEAERAELETKHAQPAGNFFRYTVQEMRESLGKDPAIDAQMADYYKSVNDANRAEFANRKPVPAGPHEASYVGVETCETCHSDAVDFWKTTKHAHAYASLAEQFKQYNLDCVSCHVAGYEKPGGSTVTHVEGLENVQCENCHGPGSLHVRAPKDPKAIIAVPPASTCLSCHHPPHVEAFDPDAKRKEILGPGHGKPAK
jgi:2',3'-cyclic-nucleotide 2'-phosphodiesterase (5'-nucleotidase family)